MKDVEIKPGGLETEAKCLCINSLNMHLSYSNRVIVSLFYCFFSQSC